MRINLFFVLTLLLFVLIASHVVLWIDHQKLHQEGECDCKAVVGEEQLMLTSLLISLFLLSISLLAYRRDGRNQLLLISIAYLILVIHCILWVIGVYFAEGDIVHTLTHELDIFMLTPAMALVLISLYRRGR